MTLARLAASALLLGASGLMGGCAQLSPRFGELLGEVPVVGKAIGGSQAPTRVAYQLDLRAPGELRALLEEHLDISRYRRLTEGQALSPGELARLANAAPPQARALLETEGYFDPRLRLSRRSESGVETLVLEVEPGPRVQVKAVEIAFEGPLQDEPAAAALRETLTQSWILPLGQPFRQAAWSEAKTALLARTRASGYALALLESTDAEVDTESQSATLRLLVSSGPLVRLGELRIEGLEHQPAETVSRLAPFTPGMPYSEKLLLDFQERVQATRLFDAITVSIAPDADNAATTPVMVRLRESPRQQATTGIGYNANTGQRITLEHLHRRPFGLNLRSRSKLELGRDLRSAELELSSYPREDMQRNLGSLVVEEDLSAGDINTSLVARVGRLRERSADERLIFVEAIRARETSGITGQTLNSGASSANVQWTLRRVDDKLLPTRGHTAWLQLGLGRADNSAGSSGFFSRAHAKLGWYRPLGSSGWHAELRGEAGQVLAKDEVGMPDRLLFRAGGDNSVRGYAYQSLGPIALDGSKVGGRVLLTGSAELARPISARYPALWGAAFIDAGNAAPRWSDYKPVLGYGLGLRVRSPVGSLRLDVARGDELQRWRLHFSVGIAL
jgi:translocation and assembly module TamA